MTAHKNEYNCPVCNCKVTTNDPEKSPTVLAYFVIRHFRQVHPKVAIPAEIAGVKIEWQSF